jgi:hypothetical protein
VALTAEQILSLAPDPSSASAGRKLADARQWKGLARSERALWGECQGSALYQVRVDLGDLVAKCTCPSRKFPCKHSIALLLLAAQSESSFSRSAEPAWVTEWLEKRGAAAEAKEKRAAAPAKPVDEAAQAKRTEKREERVREGVESLDLWMADLVRNGLGTIDPHTREWDARAARLVDAQAPALASRVRRAGGFVGSRPEWPHDVLDELGKLALLTEAWRNIDALPESLRADVRQLIGWNLTQEEVVAAGDVVRDCWFVIGGVVEEDERFRVQRSWLQGEASGRLAMVLQFATGAASFPELIAPGATLDADLAFWPGARPLRALIRERRPLSRSVAPRALAGVEGLFDHFTDLLAAQPWTDRTAVVLGGAAIEPGDPFRAIDDRGHALPLARGEHWTLAALSGGHPIDLAAEWNGRVLTPLGAIVDGRYHLLTVN